MKFNLVDYLDIYSMLKFIQTGGKTDGTGDKIVHYVHCTDMSVSVICMTHEGILHESPCMTALITG